MKGEIKGEKEREKGREGYNDIHDITAFIKHSIDLKGFSHMLSAISSLCLPYSGKFSKVQIFEKNWNWL